ncbi:ABC transporter ATP-binding protein [Spirochaetota bacterium]|nr:ABC transporter ATP-binding protein [Spirochaetota bacterium]
MILARLKNFKVLTPYFKKYIPHYVIGFAFLIVHNYGYVKFPEYMKLTLEEVSATNNPLLVRNLLLITTAYLAITCLFMYISRWTLIGLSRKIEHHFRQDLYHKLLHLSTEFYKNEQVGDLVSRITNDLNDVRTMLGPGIMYIPNSLSRIAFFIPVMITLSPILMGAIMGLIVVLVVLILFIMPMLRPLYKKIQTIRASINNEAWQFIFGISTIKLNTIETIKSNHFNKISHRYLKANVRLAVFEGFTWPLFLFIFSMSAIIILAIGGREVIAGRLNLAELLQFNIMLSILTFSVFSLGWVMSLITQGLSALERINNFFLQPSADTKKIATLPTSGKPKSITLKNLSLKDPHQRIILDNISLSIKPGEIIALTGKTGSGKTSLIELLLSIIPPSSGQILIDQTDLATIKPEILYQIITAVPQETFLFSTTIKNNIAFEEEHNPNLPRVITAAKLSAIHKEITAFPNQYNQILGERGITLSGGQKQRTAISRSLYKKASILILDDALSSVDSQTEKNIIDNLKKFKSLKTIILSSHKISLLRIADRILYLDQGRLSEQGSHSELMLLNRQYAKMARLQELKAAIE